MTTLGETLRTLVKRLLESPKFQQNKRRLILGVLVFVVLVVVGLNTSGQAPSKTLISANSSKIASNRSQLPKLYIHIVGAIKQPGLYVLKSGARVYDAVIAAGGFSAKADQGSINLARILSDGEQILVLGATALQDSNAAISGSGPQVGSGSKLVNLNRADQTALESLPGVGPTLAGRMIDWRLANGGFKTKEDLLKVSGIGDKLFRGLKDLITL
jgi:competence protein ComEA